MKGIKNKNKKLKKMNKAITSVSFSFEEANFLDTDKTTPITVNGSLRLADGFIELDEDTADACEDIITAKDAFASPYELRRAGLLMIQIADKAISLYDELKKDAADHNGPNQGRD